MDRSVMDRTESVAAEFAAQGYLALACDLYGGKVATLGWCFGGE